MLDLKYLCLSCKENHEKHNYNDTVADTYFLFCSAYCLEQLLHAITIFYDVVT